MNKWYHIDNISVRISKISRGEICAKLVTYDGKYYCFAYAKNAVLAVKRAFSLYNLFLTTGTVFH